MSTLLVRYSGDVQGVGFRATVRRLAQDYPLTGWVKNDPDGSVSMVVSGRRGDVDAFLRAVRDSRLGPLIEREVVEPQPDGSGWDGFNVRP